MTINDELIIDIKHLLGNRWSVKREDLDTHSRQIRRAVGDISRLRQKRTGWEPGPFPTSSIPAEGRSADFQGGKRGSPSAS